MNRLKNSVGPVVTSWTSARALPSDRVGAGIEILENRIAPALVINAGVPQSTEDTEFSEFPFVNTEANPADPISGVVGPGVIGEADTFYLRLSAGDKLRLYNETNGLQDFLVVNSGNLVAFFVDEDLDNEVDATELTGISLGANTSFFLAGSVNGDIVTNLDERGTPGFLADDTIQQNGLVSSAQGIRLLNIGSGLVDGKILSGGNINYVSIIGTLGSVDSILVGSAADGETYDFFTRAGVNPGDPRIDVPGGNGTISYQPRPGEFGRSIQSVYVKQIVDRIEAGGGGVGAAGGFLKNIVVLEDSDGFTLLGGQGGDAATPRGNGGAGGPISNVYVSGTFDTSVNSPIVITGGAGGAAVGGVGGQGGSVNGIFGGFFLQQGKTVPSANLLKDDFHITGGAGGKARFGGAGGNVVGVNLRLVTPDALFGDEIVIRGGAGGDNIDASGGYGGLGGSVARIVVANQDLLADSDVVIAGGDGGTSVGLAVGGSGGSVTNVDVQAFEVKFQGGLGRLGRLGGHGGSLTNITVRPGDSVVPQGVLFDAGSGGAGSGGNGGNGGNIVNATVINGDFTVASINPLTGGDGGVSVGGRGGQGGSVVGLNFVDDDFSGGLLNGTGVLRSGDGGDGTRGGGNAGSLINVSWRSKDMATVTVEAGNGGNATGTQANGAGGVGGIISNLFLLSEATLVGGKTDTTVSAGNGGNGAGTRGFGGLGGYLRAVNISTEGSAVVEGGDGGNGVDFGGGVGRAAGSGGGILLANVLASNGTGLLRGGNAGLTGVLPANGGSILGISPSTLSLLFTTETNTIRAGNGSNGGRGGDLQFVGYGSLEDDLNPGPLGNVTISAGNGSANGRYAGAGGSIRFLQGSLASDPDVAPPGYPSVVTRISAGNGGGSTLASAPGGSILNVILERGGQVGSDLIIQAGDAGNARAALDAVPRFGAAGGSVAAVSVFDIKDGTIIRSIGAGDGGAATFRSGPGGSLNDIRTLGDDIGVRSGEVFGYGTMGGLFAGVGGAVGPGGVRGLSGTVTNIGAEAVAAIVAGRVGAPDLVEAVANVYLTGNEALLTRNGSFEQNRPFTLTFGDPAVAANTTAVLPANASPADVQAALNGLPGIGVNGVSVGFSTNGNPLNTYRVRWTLGGDQPLLTGNEIVPLIVTTTQDATPDVLAGVASVDGTVATSEVQTVTVAAAPTAVAETQFTLTFAGSTTVPLPFTASTTQVENALNALVSIQALAPGDTGSVTVAAGAVQGQFVVTFVPTGDQVPLTGASYVPEIQTLDIFGAGTLSLTFGADSTGQISAAGVPDATLAQQLQTALNALPSVQALEAGNAGSVTVTVIGASEFAIRFNSDADAPDLIGNELFPLNILTDVPGSVTASEVQVIGFISKTAFSPVAYASANLVGAIVAPDEFGANVFKYVDGTATALNPLGVFAVGDMPVDGLIMARKLNRATINFIPEAYYNGTVMDDFDNII